MTEPEKAPTFWQTVGSVFAAFFGVQSSRNRVRDFKHGKPVVFIVVGLIVTALFVLTVLLAVKLAMKNAGV